MKRRSLALSFLAAMLAAEVSNSQETEPSPASVSRKTTQSVDVEENQQIIMEARRSVGRRLLEM